jgi:hypothetical protein
MLSVIYVECRKQTQFAECHYVECRYAECKGAALYPEHFCSFVLMYSICHICTSYNNLLLANVGRCQSYQYSGSNVCSPYDTMGALRGSF